MRRKVGLRLRAALVGSCTLVIVGATLFAFTAISSSASPPSEHVSTTGTDSGNCVRSPCATINYAISQASPGETINVAAGTYNQTVDINKAVSIVGAGASSTTIDGKGLDPSGSGYYGVVYVGRAGGVVNVSGFTITDPYPYGYTGGEPEAVALADPNASDLISIINDTITEGTADSNAGTDFPIGVDGFLNAASTTLSGNTISGFFQGVLLEDNGPANISGNKFTGLISNTDNSTSPATTYPAEGVFFLADEGGTYENQDATGNLFSAYSGYGIAEAAGYTGGYVTPGCVANGSIRTNLTRNGFELTSGTPAATGIALQANGTGNDLTGSVTGNHGYVTSPSNAMQVQSIAVPATSSATSCSPYGTSNGGGGTLNVTENNDDITVKAATGAAAVAGAAATPGATQARIGGLHMPRHPHHS